MWQARIVLEAASHQWNAFVTLTYSEKKVPNEVRPGDLQKFLKRLRRAYPVPLRFFACGEYGERTWRPHYHAALFGLSFLDHAYVRRAWVDPADGEAMGFVHVGELNHASAGYVAGYTTKKLTKADAPELLGRHPEFARMSLRRPGGIGAAAMKKIALELMKEHACTALALQGDVPETMRYDGRRYPLGRYLRSKLREGVGWVDGVPQAVLRSMAFKKAVMTAAEVAAEEVKRKNSELRAVVKRSIDSTRRRI